MQALAEAPVGAETVHTMGEPDAIEAQLNPEVAAVSSEGGAGDNRRPCPSRPR